MYKADHEAGICPKCGEYITNYDDKHYFTCSMVQAYTCDCGFSGLERFRFVFDCHEKQKTGS